MALYTSQGGSITSAIGVNSDTAIAGGNWSVNTYTGTGEQNDYSYVGVNLQVDEAGTLFFDFSQDGTNWSSYPVNGFTIASGINEVHTAWKGTRYFRARFVGTGGRSYFRLQTSYSDIPLPLSAPVNQSLNTDQDATVVRSVVIGQTPAGNYNNVEITPDKLFKVSIRDPLTAFGDLRATQLTPQFQGSFEYTVDNTELNSNTEVAGGTVTQSTAMCVVNTSATTGSSAEFRSKQHAKYRAGFGGNARFTALFTTGVAGTDQLIGLADETGSSQPYKNGYMIGYIGTTFGIHRFVNDTVVTVALASCDDPLDGTGRSGMTIDLTKINVFQIQFQYLGAGAIIYSVEDPLTGKFIPFHTEQYANANTAPSVYNPNFHFIIWADNGATTSDITVKSASYAYFIEGDTKFFEVHQPQFSSDKRQKAGVTSEVAIVTIRNKATYASKTNFIDLVLENVGVSIEAGATNNLGEVRLVRNATLGGSPSYTDINATDSIVDFDVAGTTVGSGKTLLVIPLAGKNDKAIIDLSAYNIILQPGETLTVAGQSANSATLNATVLWKELF